VRGETGPGVNLTRRKFLFGLVGVTCLAFSDQAKAAALEFEPFDFAYVTDAHLATGTPDTFILTQESQLFLQDVVKSLSHEKLDFVIFGGDQVEKPGPDDATWQLFLDIAQTLPCPWNFVLGEKDVSGPPAVDKMKVYGPDWKGKGIESSKSYWSLNPLPGVHLVGLDTSKTNASSGQLDSAQLAWLKDDLSKNAHKLAIVFSHHPLLPPAPYDGGGSWDDYIIPDGACAREILGGSKNVRLAVSGHVHVSKIERERDVWYVSSPSLSVYPCAYRIFRVTPEEITVETYQVTFPALIKKARGLIDQSNLAFKFNEKKPQTFAELAAGSRLDQSGLMPLTAGGVLQNANPKKKRRREEEKPPEKAPPAEKAQQAKKPADAKEDSKKPPAKETPDNKGGKKEEKPERSFFHRKPKEKPDAKANDKKPDTTDIPELKTDDLQSPEPKTGDTKSGDAPSLMPPETKPNSETKSDND